MVPAMLEADLFLLIKLFSVRFRKCFFAIVTGFGLVFRISCRNFYLFQLSFQFLQFI